MAIQERVLFILYKRDDWKQEIPLENSPVTRASFEEFYVWAKELGVQVFRAHTGWYDPETDMFKKAWSFDKEWKKIVNPPRADAYYDKTAGRSNYELLEFKKKLAAIKPFVNSPFFRLQFDSKLSQYITFQAHMPKSFLAENIHDFFEAKEKIASEKVVMKQLFGSGGKEVSIGEKSQVKEPPFSFPFLLQEFVPTSGVPGFSEENEIADLRLIFMDHVFLYALSRKAKGDSLFTNFHQGATAEQVPKEAIPQDCWQMSKKIIEVLKTFPRTYYSLDFMFTRKGKPLFIEMNTTPGFDLLHLVAPPELRKEHAEKLLSMIFKN